VEAIERQSHPGAPDRIDRGAERFREDSHVLREVVRVLAPTGDHNRSTNDLGKLNRATQLRQALRPLFWVGRDMVPAPEAKGRALNPVGIEDLAHLADRLDSQVAKLPPVVKLEAAKSVLDGKLAVLLDPRELVLGDKS
jgi:hypothetical protein